MILLAGLGVATVWSWILATRPTRPEILHLPSEYVFRLFLILDATFVFFIGGFILLMWAQADY
jgi:hypothetical protein